MTPMKPSSESDIFRRLNDVERDMAVGKNDHCHLSATVQDLTAAVRGLREDITIFKTDRRVIVAFSSAIAGIVSIGITILGIFWERK